MKQSKQSAGIPRPMSVGQAAELFSVTPAAVRGWIREGLPVVKAGGKGPGNGAAIDLEPAVQWFAQRVAAAKTRGGDDADAEYARYQRARVLKEQADSLAMDNAEARGELVSVKFFEEQMVERILACRSRLLAMPGRLAPLLADTGSLEKIKALLTTCINEAIAELETPIEFGGKTTENPAHA